MQVMKTLSGNKFQYKQHPDGELIIYASDDDGNLQEKSALVITPYTIDLVKRTIRQRGQILMGASRDKPPAGSLGEILKREGQTPQQLSYLIPILVQTGVCTWRRQGKAFLVVSAGN